MIEKNIYILHSKICKALANPKRIEIIEILNNGEMNFGELLQKLNISKSNLSQHLSIMTSNGLIIQRKERLNSFYRLSSEKVAVACQIMREVLIENLTDQINILIK